MEIPLNINQYLKDCPLSDDHLLAETNTSHVYKVRFNESFAVLKILKDLGAIDERNGASALIHFNGNGAIRIFQHNNRALLLEYADGLSLKSLVQEEKDDQATAIIAETLNQLHQQKSQISIDTFTPLKKWFRSLFARAQASDDPFFIHAASIAETLLDYPLDVCVLHGDIHHENIINSPRGWLAIDPKGLYGERTYDAANTLLNPSGMDDLVVNEGRLLKNAEILSKSLGVDMQRLLEFAYAYSALSASWSLDDGQDNKIALNVGRILKPHMI
jgi:streptomycin 6-kinase